MAGEGKLNARVTKDIDKIFSDFNKHQKKSDEVKGFEGQEGSVEFELQETFWGALQAVVGDKFGINWALNYTLESNV